MKRHTKSPRKAHRNESNAASNYTQTYQPAVCMQIKPLKPWWLFNLIGLKNLFFSLYFSYPVQGEKPSSIPSINSTFMPCFKLQHFLSVHLAASSQLTVRESWKRSRLGSPWALCSAQVKAAGELHMDWGSPCAQPCLQNGVCKVARALVLHSSYVLHRFGGRG